MYKRQFLQISLIRCNTSLLAEVTYRRFSPRKTWVPFLASLSAISFSSTSIWAGIYWITIALLRDFRFFRICLMSMYFRCLWVFVHTAWMAAWEYTIRAAVWKLLEQWISCWRGKYINVCFMSAHWHVIGEQMAVYPGTSSSIFSFGSICVLYSYLFLFSIFFIYHIKSWSFKECWMCIRFNEIIWMVDFEVKYRRLRSPVWAPLTWNLLKSFCTKWLQSLYFLSLALVCWVTPVGS